MKIQLYQPHLLKRVKSGHFEFLSKIYKYYNFLTAKEGAKTASYAGVIVVGVGVTAVVIYVIFNELFSSDSPQGLFESASQKCMDSEKVQDLLGEPIKAFGEETRRGRRRHVRHLYYQDDQGRKGLRVQFHLQGLRSRGLGEIDAREVSDVLPGILRENEFTDV